MPWTFLSKYLKEELKGKSHIQVNKHKYKSEFRVYMRCLFTDCQTKLRHIYRKVGWLFSSICTIEIPFWIQWCCTYCPFFTRLRHALMQITTCIQYKPDLLYVFIIRIAFWNAVDLIIALDWKITNWTTKNKSQIRRERERDRRMERTTNTELRDMNQKWQQYWLHCKMAHGSAHFQRLNTTNERYEMQSS